MRYLNLFSRITKIDSSHCFVYNNTIYFCVPKPFMAQALGQNGSNVKRIAEVFRKKIRIVSLPKREVIENSEMNDEKVRSIENFLKEVVNPVEFSGFLFIQSENTVQISGTRESKAILIGRDRSKEKELKEVLVTFFGIKDFRIV